MMTTARLLSGDQKKGLNGWLVCVSAGLFLTAVVVVVAGPLSLVACTIKEFPMIHCHRPTSVNVFSTVTNHSANVINVTTLNHGADADVPGLCLGGSGCVCYVLEDQFLGVCPLVWLAVGLVTLCLCLCLAPIIWPCLVLICCCQLCCGERQVTHIHVREQRTSNEDSCHGCESSA